MILSNSLSRGLRVLFPSFIVRKKKGSGLLEEREGLQSFKMFLLLLKVFKLKGQVLASYQFISNIVCLFLVIEFEVFLSHESMYSSAYLDNFEYWICQLNFSSSPSHMKSKLVDFLNTTLLISHPFIIFSFQYIFFEKKARNPHSSNLYLLVIYYSS